MRSRTCGVLLPLLLSACATTGPSLGERAAPDVRAANLQRAAQYPWTDDGHCVVREASNPWPELAERCFHALDHDRLEFRDATGRCAVASTAAVAVGVGLCVFAAPEIIVGAVLIAGVVVVAGAIQEEWEAYERSTSHERARRNVRIQPSQEQAPSAGRQPRPEGSSLGRDWLPPISSDTAERRPECRPIPVPHAGEDPPHNTCADKFPPNRYPGNDVLVNGKRFDALQVGALVLWEIKTHRFDTYPDFIRQQTILEQVPLLKEERDIAEACGYDFVVGVSTQEHKDALIDREPTLNIVVTGCKR
ncbi:MAG TPA: DUF6310 domain-containing protein [Myxococcaceae bacterium]|nr:DUF6310 domain-containing protein [Myxococcaceae bacterium]